MGTCSTKQVKSLKLDLNGFIRGISSNHSRKRSSWKTSPLFFCSKLPASKKILEKIKVKWKNRGDPKSTEKHEKRLKNHQKQPKNDQKQGKKHPKFMKNAKIKPFLARKKTIKKHQKHPKTAFFSTNTKFLQIFYKR